MIGQTVLSGIVVLFAWNASAAIKVEGLKCEYRENPLGIDVVQPRLSWRIAGVDPAARGVRQTAYRVIVASSEQALGGGRGDLWDSGKVSSDQSVHVVYAGKPLASGVKAFWKVQVWDESGAAAAWSAPAFWSMGLLAESDWKGKWIGRDEPALLKRPGSPYRDLEKAQWIWTVGGGAGERAFGRTVLVPQNRGRLKKAICVMGAENRFELSVNGTRAGAGTFVDMPEVIDITARLRTGENRIHVRAWHERKERPGALIGAIRMEFEQGEPQVIVTDGNWAVEGPAAAVVTLGAYGMQPWGEVGFSEERWLPARTLRKEFDAARQVRRATAYVSGLGLFEMHVNGVKVSEDVLSPGLTEYPKRVLYAAYDVSRLIHTGRNAVGVMLGNGRYYGPRTKVPTFARTYGYPKLLLQIEIEYTDGSKSVVISDENWRLTTEGPLRGNNEYDGEEYDARREMKGWDRAGYDDRAWQRAAVVAGPGGVMTAQMAEPIRVTGTLRPVKRTQPRPGVYIFDMGQNMVGWCRLHVSGPRGASVRLRHAETLAADGMLYVANLRSARAEDEYTLQGGGAETWEPRFTYHGFRYVEVTGYPGEPRLDALQGRVVHDAMEPAGSFESSNALLNQLHKNTYWGVRGNYRSIPTDCPQRDERQGWMGDRSQVTRGETYLFDVAAFYTKWMTDIADAQRADGAISDVSPAYWPLYNNDVTWPSTFVLLPGTLYEQYGDLRVIERNYDAMKKWMNLMRGFLKDDLLAKDTYGDWCVPPESPELIHSKDPARQTDKTLLATAYFHYMSRKMSEYAGLIGRTDDQREFADLAARLRAAFEKKFFDAKAGLYSNGTQTSSLLPLAFSITDPAQRGRVFDALIRRIETESHGHIGTGLVGAQWLMRVLSDNGRPGLAYEIATQKTYPGWGYMVEKGATTIWELWNGDTADPAMNSGNHVMQIGDLTIWMYEYLGGVRPDPEKPGYKHFFIRPVPAGDLTAVKVSRRTMYGEIRSAWKRDGARIALSVTVPANTSATIFVPGDATAHTVGSGQYEFTGRVQP